LPLPLYVAVMVGVPMARDDVLKVACPPLFTEMLAASVLEPWVKVTVPAGVRAPGATAVTVAVNVITWLACDGLTEELTAVLLDALLTCCGEPASLPVLARKRPSPEYDAVMVWLPAARFDVLNVAAPADSATLDASVVVPSLNVTVPLGAPLPGETTEMVAVNTTA